jgi:hypothetical protein
MSKLKLIRSKQFFGVFRKLKVQIDDKTDIELRYGETLSIEIPEGSHSLIAKMDWGRSRPLDITLTKDAEKTVITESKFFPIALLQCFLPPFEIFRLREI